MYISHYLDMKIQTVIKKKHCIDECIHKNTPKLALNILTDNKEEISNSLIHITLMSIHKCKPQRFRWHVDETSAQSNIPMMVLNSEVLHHLKAETVKDAKYVTEYNKMALEEETE